MKPHFFRNLTEAHAELKRLGIPYAGIKSVAAAQKAIANARKEPRKLPKGSGHDSNTDQPTPFDPKKDGLGDAIAAAKSERDISRKIDMLQALSAKQFAAMQSEPDAIRKTDLMRAWQSTEKSLAYAKLAERTASPSAAKTRRLLDLASE